MNPEQLAEAWENAAQEDAMFNILTDPQKVDCGWEADDFFDTGAAEVGRSMERLVREGHLPPEVEVASQALDFGCGVGRLTRALSTYFEEVDGVDASPTMLAKAREYATEPNITYWSNLPNDEYDLIYSTITLQHCPTVQQQRYFQAFFERLTDEGVTAVHLPDGPNFTHPEPHLSMWCASPAEVTQWIGRAGGGVVDLWDEGQDGDYRNWRYIARRLP